MAWVALNAAARSRDPEGPIVLCFPGAGAFAACDYAGLAAAVDGAAVYALQLPRSSSNGGGGGATATHKSVDAWLADAVQQYMCLRNGRAQIAVAHSLGGIIFRAFAGELIRQTGTADGFTFDRLVLGASSMQPAYYDNALDTDRDAGAFDALWAAATDAVLHASNDGSGTGPAAAAKLALASLGKSAFLADLRFAKALLARPCSAHDDAAAVAALVAPGTTVHVLGDCDPFAHDVLHHLPRTAEGAAPHVIVLPETGHRLPSSPTFADLVHGLLPAALSEVEIARAVGR